MVMEVLNVNYHHHHVGAASFDRDTGVGYFEYTPEFIKTGIELSPLKMPLSRRFTPFPSLTTIPSKVCRANSRLVAR
jgi:serine/threonine-protein kinase HipA